MSKKYLRSQVRILEENGVPVDESSSDSSEHGTICYGMIPQEHARPRLKTQKSSTFSRLTFYNEPDALSNTSLTGSITRFRGDFETFKCKIRVFGDSINICRCIADDYRSKMDKLEKRLCILEKRQKLFKKTSNYSVIIQKNKLLAHKSKKDIKGHAITISETFE